MNKQESPTSSMPVGSRSFRVKTPPTLVDSELANSSQSMILEDTVDSTTNTSMGTRANSLEMSTKEKEEEETPYRRKLRSSDEFNKYEKIEESEKKM